MPVETVNMKRARGFSLLEVTIALLLLSLVLFSLAVLIPMSQVRLRNTAHQEMAVTLAEDMLGKIRALNWSDIPAVTTLPAGKTVSNGESGDPAHTYGAVSFPPPPYPSQTYSFDSRENTASSNDTKHTVIYYYAVTAEKTSDSNPDLVIITVSITWKEAQGSGGSLERHVTLTTMVYRK
jgi:prepilin-type N-terminal cleavage/methylation domain-containing protein